MIRYFIDAENLNKRDLGKYLIESEDYSYFKNAKFTFHLDDKDNDVQYQLQSSKKEEEMSSMINLQNLKNKFDNLDVEFDEIFNFYTKIMNKLLFAKDYISMFNSKQIILESNKEKYSRRVNEIISKNYININDFIQSNSKFQSMRKFVLNEFKQNPSQRKFQFDLIDSNKAYYSKCEKMIQVINSFFVFLIQ